MQHNIFADTAATGRRVALVACSARKSCDPSAAQDLYQGPAFKLARPWAQRHADVWYCLSDLHGLVPPDQTLSPYDASIRQWQAEARRLWAASVQAQLASVLVQGDTVIFLASQPYREHLAPALRQQGYTVLAPLAGLSRGQQLRWLKENF